MVEVTAPNIDRQNPSLIILLYGIQLISQGLIPGAIFQGPKFQILLSGKLSEVVSRRFRCLVKLRGSLDSVWEN